MSEPLRDRPELVDLETEVAIIGAGGAGLCAALAAREAGAEVWLFERDPLPRGSTALSSGMIPAAGTRFQRARGIDDSPRLFASDLTRKNRGGANPSIVERLTSEAAPTVEWLVDRWQVPLGLVEGFLYPGHSRPRMHAPPSRTGEELVTSLLRAVEEAGATLVTEARVEALLVERAADGAIRGVAGAAVRRGRSLETVGAKAVVLACCGFAGSPELVRRFIPEIARAPYHGHPGNEGDALRWGEALAAALADLDAYQGHAALAVPHGILISWAIVMEGGIQVDLTGARFADETEGYSEQAARLLARPGGVGWIIFDARLLALAHDFADFREAEALGAVREAADVAGLAAATGLPPAALRATIAEVQACARGERRDRFGRDFTGKPPLEPPFYAVKVSPALFHTQGGLEVDADGRVLWPDGRPIPGLFAAGGAARGVSGRGAAGYLSGNGLLSAVVLGRLAGAAAARRLGGPSPPRPVIEQRHRSRVRGPRLTGSRRSMGIGSAFEGSAHRVKVCLHVGGKKKQGLASRRAPGAESVRTNQTDQEQRGIEATEDLAALAAELEDRRNVEDETETEPRPISVYSISSWGADLTAEQHAKRVQKNVYRIPSFQRSYVWSRRQASRFIESLLLGLPIPSLFLYKEESSTFLIVDGQQRLKTISFFFKGVFQEGMAKDRVFALEGVDGRWNGKTYDRLSDDDRQRLDDSIIHAIIFRQDRPEKDKTSVFRVFERLNTGGMNLSAQEIRTCVAYGSFVERLRKLNEFEDWRVIFGKKSIRLKDQELILRFLALHERGHNYERPMADFLNSFMIEHRDNKEALEKFERLFRDTIACARRCLGDRAFRPENALNAALFDACMVALARRLSRNGDPDPNCVRSRYEQLVKDPEFEKLYRRATADRDSVIQRIERATRAFSDC